MSKKAVVTGVLGQDGSHISDLLLEKGYEVFGVHRRTANKNTKNIDHIDSPNFKLVEADICDPSSVAKVVRDHQPDEFYNLAAMSHVGSSFTQPSYNFDVNTKGVLNCLEAIKQFNPTTRFYQASTSEMFGKNFTEKFHTPELIDFSGHGVKDIIWSTKYQDENTPFAPRSPYGVAKTAAHYLVQNYRESYNLFSCSGILFNHEGPRRGEDFVTRKITKWIGKNYDPLKHEMKQGKKLQLGNLNAYRDWGHSRDYVRAMWLMLQQDQPKDYVISTGETHSVQEFLEACFEEIKVDWKDYVEIDTSLCRPSEVDYLRGDSTLANKELGWTPTISFKELVHEMVWEDILHVA